jgi:predicted HTH domain antitoxin
LIFAVLPERLPLKISLELPRDLLGALNVPETGLSTRLKELIALELFREGRISSGKGAELLGLSKAEFIQLLARYNINYFTESPAELIAEVAALEQLLNEGE